MKHKCAFCTYQTDDIVACGQHYETAHKTLLPSGMSGEHFAYYMYSGRKEGRCVVCHKPTKFNEKTHKYYRICSAKCKRKYGEIKKLNDPKVQENMLQHRKISGEYKWSTSDDSGVRPVYNYTGSYELDFVKYMDTAKHWNPNDLMMPCPYTFNYRYDGQNRFYIPDAYIPSIDLVIEIKDGDPNNPSHHANMHPDIQRVNREKEKLKKAAVNKSQHNYIVIYNKDYRDFELYLRTSKKQYLTEDIDSLIDNLTTFASNDVQQLLLNMIDTWRDYVKENSLESYCVVSSRLNDILYNVIKSDKFNDALKNTKGNELVNDMLIVSAGSIGMVFPIMDTDIEIKSNLNDPYAIYTAEYTSALKSLSKWWKNINQFVYLGKNATVERDDKNDHRVAITILLN